MEHLTIDRTDPANQPPTADEASRYYNLEAALVWREDGYVTDWSLIPDVPVRVLEWDRHFWLAVAPQRCPECGEITEGSPEPECLECRYQPFGSEWQREQEERFPAGRASRLLAATPLDLDLDEAAEAQAERDALRWLRGHRLASVLLLALGLGASACSPITAPAAPAWVPGQPALCGTDAECEALYPDLGDGGPATR